MLKRKDYVYFSFIKLQYCIHNISGIDTVNWHEIYFCSLRNMERAIKWSSLWSEVCNPSNNLVLRMAIIIVSKFIQKIIELCIIIALMLVFLSLFCGYRNTNVLITVKFKGAKTRNRNANGFQNLFNFWALCSGLILSEFESSMVPQPLFLWQYCNWVSRLSISAQFINSKLELYFPIFLSSLHPSLFLFLAYLLSLLSFYFLFLSILILCTLWFCMQELGRFVVLV